MFLLKTSISSMYSATNKSLSLNILSIFLWNIDGAFFKPNGITSHSKCPSRQEKVVQGIISNFF